jgi:hypothetical protein
MDEINLRRSSTGHSLQLRGAPSNVSELMLCNVLAVQRALRHHFRSHVSLESGRVSLESISFKVDNISFKVEKIYPTFKKIFYFVLMI